MPITADFYMASLVSQWLCFPPAPATPGQRQAVQVYRVLLETASGRIAWLAVSQREAPDMAFIETVARRLDSPVRSAGVARTLAARLFHEDDIIIEEIDENLEDDTAWGVSQALNRKLLAAVAERKAFMDGLREDVLTAMRPLGGLRPPMYNYLIAGSEEISRNRVQSLRLFPILHRQMLTPAFKDIQRIIDQGLPLVDALAERHAGFPAATVTGHSSLMVAARGRRLGEIHQSNPPHRISHAAAADGDGQPPDPARCSKP